MNVSPVDPPLDQVTLQHWHRLITAAANHDGPIATVDVPSLMHLLRYAATAAEVLDEAGLGQVASGEADADVRAIGRHLRLVDDEPGAEPE